MGGYNESSLFSPVSEQHVHYIPMEGRLSNNAKCPSTLTIQHQHLALEWRHLTLQASSIDLKTKSTANKTILNNVGGFANPGELLVIMGPSGAGKSSLLDCISGRNANVKGTILVNGNQWTKSLKRKASYVMQDDLFYGTLTVEEHLIFQAKLKLGKKASTIECKARVNAVVEELGLSKCRSTLIGNARIRGISGGERKRLSLAAEILTNPSMLFADEPTSGLDSFMAEQVVVQLQQLARAGRTVIATIHQPSSELLALFDQLYLVCDGACVYHGKASASVSYFASLGYSCPSFINPCDYFMRQLVVMDTAVDHDGVNRVELLKAAWREKCSVYKDTLLASKFLKHELDIDDSTSENWQLEGLQQIGVLAHRNVVRLLRDRVGFIAHIVMSSFVALLVGSTYHGTEMSQAGIQSFVGVFFFMSVNQVMSSANPAFVHVPMELPIILREYKGGLYNLLSWYMAKNLSEIPVQLLLPFIFFTPAYLLVGFGHGFMVYLRILWMLMLENSCAIGLGYFVSCMVRRVDIAPMIGTAFILPFLLFGGLLVNSDITPSYLIWIKYISPIKYCFESVMQIFWTQVDNIECDNGTLCLSNGNEVLQHYAIDVHHGRTVLENMCYLILINLAFRVFAFITLWMNVRNNT